MSLRGLAGISLALCMLATACGGGKSKVTNLAPVQFVTPASSPSIDQGQSVSVTVAVADNSAVTWSLQVGFGKPAGTLSNQTATSATYTAPADVGSETQVTIIATAGSNSAALGVFVEPAPQVTGTSSTTVPTCPNVGSIVLSTSAGTKNVGQALAQGQFDIISSGGVAPFTWTVASGSLPTGLSFVPETDTSRASIVGTPVSAGCSTFTMQVTDAAGVSATSQPINLVVIPPGLKVSAPNLGQAFVDATNVGVPYPPAQFVGTGGVEPYHWTLAPGTGGQSALPPGLSISSTGTITGVPTSDGLIQNGGFGVYSATLWASDSQLPYPATALPNVSIGVFNADSSCGTGSESNLAAQGTYAFLLRGFDASGPVTIAGNFTVDGAGAITGGSEDISRSTGAQSGLSIMPGSTYTLGLNNRGCVTLTNSAGTTTTFRMVVSGCSNGRNSQGTACQPDSTGSFHFTVGHLMEFDDNTGSGTRVAGILRLQDPSAFQDSAISGLYAFGLSGWDSAGGRFAMAGSANASASAWSAVAADTNDAGTVGAGLTGGTGTFSIASGGRGTGTLNVGSLSLNVVLYPVSSREVMVATFGPPSSSNPTLSGEAISTTGPFNMQSLQNTHMFHIAGLSATGPDPSVGLFTFDGIGGVSGTEYENQAGTIATTALSGVYAVDSTTGRVAFSALQNQTLGLHPLVAYVIPAASNLTSAACNVPAACVTGFLVSTDSTAQGGVLEFQTSAIAPPPPFTISSLLGVLAFGTDEDQDAKTANVIGRAGANPASAALTITEDLSFGDTQFCLEPSCVLLISNEQESGGYGVSSNGSGAFGGQTLSVTNGAVTFFIDASPLDAHPAVVVVEE